MPNQTTKQATVVAQTTPTPGQQMEQVAFFNTSGQPLFFTSVAITQMPLQANSAAADVAALNTNFNALLTKLKNAGLMASS